MKILLLSRYGRAGASSRYRSFQYLPMLEQRGHHVTVAPLLSDLYVEQLYGGRQLPYVDVAASYVSRISRILDRGSYDLVWIEYEAFPWIPAALEAFLLRGGPAYVVDLDDAVFHRYDLHSARLVRQLLGKKIDRVMNGAALVLAGNEYLADRARAAGASRVEIVPTVVDLEAYPTHSARPRDGFSIGWIGSPSTVHYLRTIEEPLSIVCASGGVQLVVIGATPDFRRSLPVQVKRWSEATEVDELTTLDVGIMPLVDAPWERGKCGHKLIQYMASSLPVVASPVGVNRTIVSHGHNGFLATTTSSWVDALTTLRQDPALRAHMGANGRSLVSKSFSLQVMAPHVADLFESVQG